MQNFIVILIVAVIIGLASRYIYKTACAIQLSRELLK